MRTYDCLIVGAGVVGACCALLLSKYSGKRVGLIGSMHVPDTVQRAYALNRVSEQVLELAGIWHQIERSAYTSMYVYDMESATQLDYQATHFAENNLGHIVTDKSLCTALRTELSNQELFWNESQAVKVQQHDSGGTTVYMDDESVLEADLVIAADGRHSSLAEQLGMAVAHTPTGDASIVCTIHCQHQHGNCARQWFSHQSVVALLPLVNRQQLSLVWSTAEHTAEHLTGQPKLLERALTNTTLGALGKLTCLSQPVCFPVTQHIMHKYYKDTIVFIGDAVHSVHPLAGQGLNMGMHDCLILFDELVHRHSNPLFHYQQRRQMNTIFDVTLMQLLQRGFRSSNPLVQLARKNIMQLFDTSPFSDKAIKLALYGGMSRDQLAQISAIGTEIL